MAGEPRKHHFVPQFYLAGFTTNGSNDGELHGFDKNRRKTFRSTPRGVAHKRDFHKIVPGPQGDEMAVEKALGKVECQWNTVLSAVIKNTALPEGESFGDLMMFVGFLAVRVLRIRNIISDFIDRVSKAQIQMTLATPEGQASLRQTLADLGHAMPDEEFDKLVQFGQSGEYTVDYEQTWHVQEMIQMAATIAPILSLRKWRIWVADESAPDLNGT